jgi:purine-cytosine permease-like protein
LRHGIVKGGLESVEPLTWEAAMSDIVRFLRRPKPAVGSFLAEVSQL